MVKINNSPASGVARGRKSNCLTTSVTMPQMATEASNTSAPVASPGLASEAAVARIKRPDLIDVAIAEADFFHADRMAYASIPLYEGTNRIGREVCLVESQRFGDWLGHVEIRERGEGLTGAALKKLTAT